MKKETRELIDGLKLVLRETAQDNDGMTWLNCKGNNCLSETSDWSKRILKGQYNGCLSVDPESNYNKLFALLDSLEGLENQLKHGGFIPDRNGKPCKDGDKIEICLDGLRSGEIVHGQLRWDDKHYQFLCEGDDISLSPGEKDEADYIGIQWFEKEVNMGLEMFIGATADIRMIEKDLYSVVIRSANGKQIAKFNVDDRLDDTWQGFKVGDEEYDINIYDTELYGSDDETAKWGATVYPGRNGYIDTQIMVRLKVKEV